MTDEEFSERYATKLASLLVERQDWLREVAIDAARKTIPRRHELTAVEQHDPEEVARSVYLDSWGTPGVVFGGEEDED